MKRTKSCPYCAETIQVEAVVCRYCRFDLRTGRPVEEASPPEVPQRDLGAAGKPPEARSRAGRIVLIGAGALVFLMLGCGESEETSPPQAPATSSPVSGAELDRFDRRIKSWADGRDWTWQLKRMEGGMRVVAHIEISPKSNVIARKGYCRVLRKDGADILGPERELGIGLYVAGELVMECPQRDVLERSMITKHSGVTETVHGTVRYPGKAFLDGRNLHTGDVQGELDIWSEVSNGSVVCHLAHGRTVSVLEIRESDYVVVMKVNGDNGCTGWINSSSVSPEAPPS